MPFEISCSFSELFPQEIAIKEIKKWFNTGKCTQDFFDSFGEKQRREYPLDKE